MPYYRCPECGLTTHSVAGYSTVGMCAECEAPLPFDEAGWPASAGKRTKATRNGTGRLQEGVAS